MSRSAFQIHPQVRPLDHGPAQVGEHGLDRRKLVGVELHQIAVQRRGAAVAEGLQYGLGHLAEHGGGDQGRI